MEQPNLSYINTLSGGDKAFEAKLISIIKEEYPLEKDVYVKNIESNKFKEAAENVHKLKHKISLLGLAQGFEIATKYEKELRDNNTDLHVSFVQVLDKIDAYLNK